jgi:predicted O-linked N-acetylglucosamine transferase (SPINDLY family)
MQGAHARIGDPVFSARLASNLRHLGWARAAQNLQREPMTTTSIPGLSTSRQIRHYVRARAWCEWDDFNQWPDRVRADLAHDGAALWPPFVLLSMPGIDAATQLICAQRWMGPRLAALGAAAAAAALKAESPCLADAGLPARPLKLGYLSGDFQQHATALLMVEMLEAHSHQDIELYAYSHGHDDGLGMRARLVAAFHRFHDIRALSDADAAALIRADGIDILVDLKGYTAGSRTLLLAHRPAPVQVSYLGFPGTLGQGFVDYLISDRFVTPEAGAAGYTEALACMPHSYQPHGRVPAADGAAPDRAALGLPEQAFVFACFNQAFKFTPAVFDIWCRLLRELPGSVLWLLDDAQAKGNLRAEALARGVDPHRLVFAADMPQAAHLARLPAIDLMLDTWPYNAHTTASDALCAGVPLVTCAGETFASRVAGGLLRAVGLGELVTTTPEAYADLALALAQDPARLSALRTRLQAQRHAADLFNVQAYTRALEALYARMWARHTSGQAPIAIDMSVDGDGWPA